MGDRDRSSERKKYNFKSGIKSINHIRRANIQDLDQEIENIEEGNGLN